MRSGACVRHAEHRLARIVRLPAASRWRADREGAHRRMGTRMTRTIKLTVNGTAHERPVEPRLLLADFLRGSLGLTGTHVGCEHGVCGACTVLVDGDSMRACLLFAVQLDGCSIETVESLGTLNNL